MTTIAIQIPDVIVASDQYNLDTVKQGIQQGFMIWEYLSGHVSLEDCGKMLKIGYRGFIELLWSKGIPLDTLSNEELQQQIHQVKSVFPPI